MSSIRRSLAFSLIERYLLILLALASNIILARLMTPEQIGVYSVSLAVLGIAQVVRDFGIGAYLVQKSELREGHIRTAFGFALSIGAVLFLVVNLVAPYAGKYYGEPLLADIVQLASINLLILPFCSISINLLRRDLQFDKIMRVSLVAGLCGFVTSIVLVYLGWGPFGLAIGAIVVNALTGLGSWMSRQHHRILLPSFKEWRDLLRFGGQNTATSIVTTISIDVNDLVIGKVLGFAQVAILSRAQGLMNLFQHNIMSAIRSVALAGFSKLSREGEELESRFVQSISAVTVFAWPFYGFMALFPLDLMRLMFGEQWDSAADLVIFFSLAGAVAATSNLILPLVVAVGRVDLQMKVELFFQPLRAALIAGAAIVFESLQACAVAFMVAYFIHAPLLYYTKSICLKNDFLSLHRALSKSGVVAMISLSVPATIKLLSSDGQTGMVGFQWLFLAGVSTAIMWIIGIQITGHPLANESFYIRSLAIIRRFFHLN